MTPIWRIIFRHTIIDKEKSKPMACFFLLEILQLDSCLYVHLAVFAEGTNVIHTIELTYKEGQNLAKLCLVDKADRKFAYSLALKGGEHIADKIRVAGVGQVHIIVDVAVSDFMASGLD